jgi:hypothetical protein
MKWLSLSLSLVCAGLYLLHKLTKHTAEDPIEIFRREQTC